MENPIKMDDLEVPLFLETPICIYIYSNYICFWNFKSPGVSDVLNMCWWLTLR